MVRTSDLGFLDAIRAAPDDDAPRLIYADWLEEQRTPAQIAHAAFIRSDCALARAGPDHPERIALEIRTEALRKDFSRLWGEELTRFGVRSCRFERGFVVGFAIDAGPFVANGEELARRLPAWCELHLQSTRELLPSVLAHPALERLAGLSLKGQTLGLAGAQAIARSERLANLERLNVSDCGIPPEGLAAIASSAQLPRLNALDLTGNGLHATNVARLADTPLGRRLTRLAVGPIFDSVRALADAAFPQLTQLALLNASIYSNAGAALAEGPLLKTVERLDLSGGQVDLRGASRLFSRETLARCSDLALDRCQLRYSDAEALSRATVLPQLKRLRLAHNPTLGPHALAKLARDAAWTQLESLDLSECHVSDGGAKALAASPALAELKSLLLRENRIGCVGAAELAQSEYLSKLVELRLERNQIEDLGAQALGASETLRALRTLSLAYNPLGDAGVEALAGCDATPGRLTSLQRLHLVGAHVGRRGAHALANTLTLRGLRELSVSDDDIPADGIETLVASPNLDKLLVLQLSRGAVVRLSR